MDEWLSYSLSDLLLFSPETWYRLIARYNAAIWPVQLVTAAIGLSLFLAARRPTRASDRFIALMLAACWLWVALAFHIDRYATINWAATWFGTGFAFEAMLLVVVGLAGWLHIRSKTGRTGALLFLFALIVQPLIGPLVGRDWRTVEIFGVMPDPTVVATLGILLCANGRVRWALLAVPLLWCAISGMTAWTMAAPDAWVMPLAGGAALGVSLWRRRATRGRRSSEC